MKARCTNVDKQVQGLMKEAKKLPSLREKYDFYIITSLTFGGDIRNKLEIAAAM
ncbi:hypothetical protein BCV72DRAFT_222646 [Rhizopus microsporus var. microsporus]|uniref:Uncharacterized protein n=1 Tax=Rhizopus microsporus var. microsporus TaxID=86635 RepID=A0A1X0RD04_RHIZD|nr:hypothetical protein BCV72DRAFT_222646 [Rhizopus microsporus var. microsporus]